MIGELAAHIRHGRAAKQLAHETYCPARSAEKNLKNIIHCHILFGSSGTRSAENFLKNIAPCSTICGISGPFSSTPSSSFIQQAKLNNYLSVIGHISSVWQNWLMCFRHQHKH